MRLLFALAVVLATPSASAAKPYLSVDLAGERTSGAYHWSKPAIGLSALSTTLTGYGVALGGAVGVTLARTVSLAIEGSGGYDSGSAASETFGALARGRVGLRFELRDEQPFYVRAGIGLEWLHVSASSDDVYGWDPESMHGFYGALSVGVRNTLIGPFIRAEVARDTSEHADFLPVTLAIGADLTF